MIQKKIILEVPKSADFHSAVLTSFSFDFHHFESQVLRQLKSKGIININVFADDRMLDQAIGQSTGFLKSLSSSYSVNGVSSIGAFHSKVMLLAGENCVTVVQGSGNITNGGHGKNHELFGVLYVDSKDSPQLPLIQETWSYLKLLSSRTAGLTSEKIAWVENNCTFLKPINQKSHQWNSLDKEIDVSLLYNEESNIWSQLTSLLPKDKITKISIFAPFYDENGRLVQNLAEHFESANIHAFIQEGRGIHPHKLPKHERISFFKWENTQRAKLKLSKISDRKLHAKILVFETTEHQYCLFGSPNPTLKAFGTLNNKAPNDEFGMLYRSSTIDFNEYLGLLGKHEKALPIEQIREIEEEKELDDNLEERTIQLKIIGVDQDGKALSVFLSPRLKYTSALLRIFNAWGKELEEVSINKLKAQNLCQLKKALPSEVAFVQFFNSNGASISNKQVVNRRHDLINTNPSRENRRLLRLASIIELGNDKVFDVVDYMNTLRSSRSETNLQSSRGSKAVEVEDKEETISLSYDEVFSTSDEEWNIKKKNGQHNSVRIWDAIEKYFNQLSLAEEEEDMDDEEEGESNVSRIRKVKKVRKPPIPLGSSAILIRRRQAVERFLSNYLQALKNSNNHGDHKVGLIDLAMFLITIKQLFEFTHRKVIIKSTLEPDSIEDILYPIQGDLSEINSFTGASLNIIGNLITHFKNHSIQEPEDEYNAQKLKHYQSLAFRSCLFALSITSFVYKAHSNGQKWTKLLAYNLFSIFGLPSENIEAHLEEFLKNVSIPDLDQTQLISIISSWASTFGNLDRNKYLIDEKLGICAIEKHIPNNTKPKFLKISRPGFDYDRDQNEFILKKVYDFDKQSLMQSLQNFKRTKH